jgi:hypothetical protein
MAKTAFSDTMVVMGGTTTASWHRPMLVSVLCNRVYFSLQYECHVTYSTNFSQFGCVSQESDN